MHVVTFQTKPAGIIAHSDFLLVDQILELGIRRPCSEHNSLGYSRNELLLDRRAIEILGRSDDFRDVYRGDSNHFGL